MSRPLSLSPLLLAAICAAGSVLLAAVLITVFFPATPTIAMIAWALGTVAIGGVTLIVYFVLVAGWRTWGQEAEMSDTQWLLLEADTTILELEQPARSPEQATG